MRALLIHKGTKQDGTIDFADSGLRALLIHKGTKPLMPELTAGVVWELC